VANASRYLSRPLTQVRRRDRALEDGDWLDRFLAEAPVGHLAIVWEGQPFLHTKVN